MRHLQVLEFLAACRRWARRALQRPERANRSDHREETAVVADPGPGDARTRFWSEFRAGQREAAARIARRARG